MALRNLNNEVWLSLVERYVRDVEAASSNLVTSTKKQKGCLASLLFFCLRWRFSELVAKQLQVRIPRSEIDKLACQAESAGIFTQGVNIGSKDFKEGCLGYLR